ncbi:DUF4139 domain-containing protein [Marilutibacter chinensis]|uniref:DUF4139 domain-containing protein n=1 Tax=Marilutibacter chinensis TaxID=2912247 RepID=A0ABS9HWR5_9GAMM|nr:DUF4139 domain-containing protein [Lysobacter chinensis]MCF7222605.1 DUF4139 domain-containing protein [Lysobacter chinensis]
MRHPLSLLAAACLLAACSPSGPSDGGAPRQPADSSARSTDTGRAAETDAGEGTRLTVYSGDYEALRGAARVEPGMPGYALVERTLRYALNAGSNEISATRIPPAMDVEAAVLRPEADGVAVRGQRYIAPLAGTVDVLTRAIGQRVAVEHTSGGAKQTDSGILLAAGDGLSLGLSDGRVKVIRDYDNFSVIAANDTLPREAALQWTVEAEKAGNAAFALSYPMGGMAWRAEYRATIAAGDDCRLSLDGAALVVNQSGVGFDNARLTLVAGQPERTGNAVDGARGYAMELQAAAPAADAPPPPGPRRSGEYHAYDLPGLSRIGSGAVERLPLFEPRPAVECRRTYVVDGGSPGWIPPVPQLSAGYRGRTGELPVTATVSFDNSAEAGLGQPLPAGRVRVFDGNDFLGESTLAHTPEGREIRLQVGTAFDLSAERKAAALDVDRSGRQLTESFELTLGNAGDEAKTIRVIEPMMRWTDWEIVASSLPVAKKDAQSAEFEVPVPAKGEAKLSYTVRYRWPEGLRP